MDSEWKYFLGTFQPKFFLGKSQPKFRGIPGIKLENFVAKLLGGSMGMNFENPMDSKEGGSFFGKFSAKSFFFGIQRAKVF